MAKNIGAIDKRVQYFNPITKQWVKASTKDGKFMDVKTSGGKFKGVRKDK